MIANRITKIILPNGGAAVLALFLTASIHAQNVGIGFTNPASTLSVNGNLAVGINAVAPGNGALINGFTCIGTTAPDPGATGANNPYLTVASNGNSNITLRPSTNAPSTRAGIFFGDNTYLECTDSTTNGNKDLTFFNVGTQANVLTLSANNRVGINTATPTQAALVVAGSVTGSISSGEFFNFNSGPTLLSFGTVSGGWGIYAAGGIAASGDVVTNSNIVSVTTFNLSDIRLKNVISRSDSEADLETLEKLQVTDYTMKDRRFAGRQFKKLIAQEVEQVYPEAVTKTTDAVPDIDSVGQVIKVSDGLCEISMDKEFSLKSGDRVEIFGPDRLPQLVTAQNVSGKSFSAELKGIKAGSKVLVYGHEVSDLRTLDYDAISMLNVSATQELAKRVEALEQENAHLRTETKGLTAIETENAQLRADNAKLGADVEALKKAVASMQQKENGLEKAVLKQ
ncbi:MAG TPA: tail fiber domain-containing protein [Chthoniobacterales bacterium]|nr:tail fiber domain-containing protein [Chthoniobacterales bacterium]